MWACVDTVTELLCRRWNSRPPEDISYSVIVVACLDASAHGTPCDLHPLALYLMQRFGKGPSRGTPLPRKRIHMFLPILPAVISITCAGEGTSKVQLEWPRKLQDTHVRHSRNEEKEVALCRTEAYISWMGQGVNVPN